MSSSAGIVLYRRRGSTLELLIAHPGGPFWAKRDEGAWSIPKGELGGGESPEAAALREFAEETGHRPEGELVGLGSVRLRSGKVVHGFAVQGDMDPGGLRSNLVTVRWPPRSERTLEIPEIDRVMWVSPAIARVKLNPAQVPFVDRLLDHLSEQGVDHKE